MSSAARRRAPRPAPTPIPAFAPVLKPPPPPLESLELPAAEPTVVEITAVVTVGVPSTVVDWVVVSAEVDAGVERLLSLPEPVGCPPLTLESVLGRKPPCQSRLSPVADPRLTTLASTDASLKATVRDDSGHQHGFVVVTVLDPRLSSHPTHSLDVPLQYVTPTHASPVARSVLGYLGDMRSQSLTGVVVLGRTHVILVALVGAASDVGHAGLTVVAGV